MAEKPSKRCPKCQRVSDDPSRDFCKSSKRKDGLAVHCRACDAEKSKTRRKKPIKYADEYKKECTKCGIVKLRGEFPKCSRLKDGLAIYCRACQSVAVKSSREKYGKEWNAKQSAKINNTPVLRINYRILGLVRKALDRKVGCRKPSSVTSEFWRAVGYTRQQLCDHLESLFLDGMGWHNLKDWHIDHKKPVKLCNFESFNDPQFLECWSLENLRPLWARDNLRKGCQYPCEQVL